MNRRIWLERTIKTAGAAMAGVLGIPVLLHALSPIFERERGPRWRAIGNQDDYPIGEVVKAVVQLDADTDRPVTAWGSSRNHGDRARTLARKGVFVWRRSEEEIIVYSRNCTDLSCPVTWDEGSGWFYCPCHGGIFTIEGEPVAGPPNRPLYRYATRVRHGVVEIDLNSLPPMT